MSAFIDFEKHETVDRLRQLALRECGIDDVLGRLIRDDENLRYITPHGTFSLFADERANTWAFMILTALAERHGNDTD